MSYPPYMIVVAPLPVLPTTKTLDVVPSPAESAEHVVVPLINAAYTLRSAKMAIGAHRGVPAYVFCFVLDAVTSALDVAALACAHGGDCRTAALARLPTTTRCV